MIKSCLKQFQKFLFFQDILYLSDIKNFTTRVEYITKLLSCEIKIDNKYLFPGTLKNYKN